MTDLLAPKNLDRLEEQGGACIVYTHFASQFVGADGRVAAPFRRALEDLAGRAGWFVPWAPCSTICAPATVRTRTRATGTSWR